jgi:very-short-patch-repair endonuclease
MPEDTCFHPEFYAEVAELANARSEMFHRELEPLCESPIEVLFGASFLVTTYLLGIRVFVATEGKPIPPGADVLMFPQKSVGQYRADFLLSCPSSGKDVVVECDGHDFHERTKEQAARDRSRDRAMQRDGFIVMRFTGSELYKSPIYRAFEVIDVLKVTRGKSS